VCYTSGTTIGVAVEYEYTKQEMKDMQMYDLWRILRVVQQEYADDIDAETAQLIEALLNKVA